MAFRAAVCIILLSLFAGLALAEDAAVLSVSLKPEKDGYTLDEAVGGVTLTARFENSGQTEIFLVHPSASVPDDFDGKGVFHMDERNGRSEILLYITGPDGKETLLRHSVLRGFEPGNRSGLKIAPGGSEEVRFGWLGPYFALGMWDDLREPLFTERGEYRTRMVYRNRFTKALSFGTPGKVFLDEAPWTGEAESNAVSIRVE